MQLVQQGRSEAGVDASPQRERRREVVTQRELAVERRPEVAVALEAAGGAHHELAAEEPFQIQVGGCVGAACGDFVVRPVAGEHLDAGRRAGAAGGFVGAGVVEAVQVGDRVAGADAEAVAAEFTAQRHVHRPSAVGEEPRDVEVEGGLVKPQAAGYRPRVSQVAEGGAAQARIDPLSWQCE